MKTEITLFTLSYHVPCLRACVVSGLGRTVTEIECNLDLECDAASGTPLSIYLSDFGEVETLYEKLGEFIKEQKAKGHI